MEKNEHFHLGFQSRKWNKLVDILSIDVKNRIQNITQWLENEKIQQCWDKEYLVEIQWIMHYIKYSESIYSLDEKQYSEWNELITYSNWVIENYKFGKLPAIWFVYVDNNNNFKSVFYDKVNGFHGSNNSNWEIALKMVESFKNKI